MTRFWLRGAKEDTLHNAECPGGPILFFCGQNGESWRTKLCLVADQSVVFDGQDLDFMFRVLRSIKRQSREC